MSDTKEYIVDKAYELFINNSYEGVSISDISKAVELTKGALYHHFENKEAIFKAVIDKFLIININTLYSEDITFYQFAESSISESKNIVHSIIGEKMTYMPINYLALMIDAMRHYPGFIDGKLNLFETEVQKIEKVLKIAIKRGEIRSDINPKIMAINFFSLSFGLATSLMQNNSSQQAIELLKEQIHEFYNVLKI